MERPASSVVRPGRRRFAQPFVVQSSNYNEMYGGGPINNAGGKGMGSQKDTMKAFQGLARATKSLRDEKGMGKNAMDMGKGKGKEGGYYSYDLFSDNHTDRVEQHMTVPKEGAVGCSDGYWPSSHMPQHMLATPKSELKLIRGRYYDYGMMEMQVTRAMALASCSGAESDSLSGESAVSSGMYGYSVPPPPQLARTLESNGSSLSSLSGNGRKGNRGWRVPQTMFERSTSCAVSSAGSVESAQTPAAPTLSRHAPPPQTAISRFCIIHVDSCRPSGLSNHYPTVFVGDKGELLSQFVSVQKIHHRQSLRTFLRFLPPKNWVQEQEGLKMAYAMAGVSFDNVHQLFVTGDSSMIADPGGMMNQIDVAVA